jgi:N-carbamoylputrescine amidase
MAMSDVLEENVSKAHRAGARGRARRGATAVVLPELFEGTTGRRRSASGSSSARTPVEGTPFIGRFQALARELGVVLPLSFFERAGTRTTNSLVMIDATGER